MDVNTRAGLRRLLNEWNVIGVPDEIEDEYDCLIEPLAARLSDGADRTALATYLRTQLRDHFGLDPTCCGIDEAADRLVTWWSTARPA